MSRAAAALTGSWLCLCVLNSGAGMAVAMNGAHHAQFVVASDETNSAAKGAGAQTKPKVPAERPVKEPARQVPVKPFEEPPVANSGKKSGKPSGEETEKKEADTLSGKKQDKPAAKTPATATGSPAVKAKGEKPVKATSKSVKQGSSAKAVEMTAPGLPIRKPRKPVFRKNRVSEQVRKNPSQPRSERDKKLCKALQKCRDEFVKCKSKIKHPDQSEPWIIAKEVCGGHYKVCVEKDFRPGEWFMTRWFYFQKLNCGE